ncbi:hypothetical protein ANN_24311 [Periplaneta americana]|uniref:Uncharacterized protein n=1 Tax=Periplaneta americana TaxID=6978 RepID=A0ABQ8S2Q5_PERAM|nr:hypothetical protein ANN_24311 [Periplaneta americana]
MMLKPIRKKKRNWLGHWLRRNYILKDVLEGMVNWRRVLGRRRYQIIDDIKIYGSYAKTKRKTENRKDWTILGLHKQEYLRPSQPFVEFDGSQRGFGPEVRNHRTEPHSRSCTPDYRLRLVQLRQRRQLPCKQGVSPYQLADTVILALGLLIAVFTMSFRLTLLSNLSLLLGQQHNNLIFNVKPPNILVMVEPLSMEKLEKSQHLLIMNKFTETKIPEKIAKIKHKRKELLNERTVTELTSKFNFGREVQTAVKRWFRSQTADFYDTRTQKLIQWYDKCLNSSDGYVDK